MTANQFDVYATNGCEVSVITTAHSFTVRIEDETLMMTREEGEALHAALARALGFTD